MAGLFELQLPRQSRSRRSQDVQDRRLDTGTSIRSNSPPPEVTAREIVGQVIARRDAASPAATSSSSIFPWKRRAAGQDPSRQSSDASPRNSADTSGRSDSQSPVSQRKYSGRLSPRGVTAPALPSSPTSPRVSTSIDFTLTPSSPAPARVSNDVPNETGQSHASSALARAGLGIGFPPIGFPGRSSPVSTPPVSRANSTKRKTSSRPGTAHGNITPSSSTLSFKVEHVRRVKSFTKGEPTQAVGKQNTKPSGNMTDSEGDVLVLARDRPFSAAPHAHSMPEWYSRNIDFKGKGKAPASDAEIITPTPENSGNLRGRQFISLPPLAPKDREQSATRRTSWWPGRRRIDSSPVNPRTPLPPPPIPQRSQARPTLSGHPTPSLPTFRPFSPLIDNFPITESSPPSATTFDDRENSRKRESEDAVLHIGATRSPPRRHLSLSNRTGGTHSHASSISSQQSSRPASQAYPQSHRYSWSMSLSSSPEHNLSSLQSTPSSSVPWLTSSADALNHRNKPQPVGSSMKSTRRRSMTVNSPPVSLPRSPVHESTPLLLRRPVSRPNTSVGTPDPFLTGAGAASGTRTSVENPDGVALPMFPIEMQRTPSTSSGSTSSLSHSAPATRSQRQRAGTTPPARTLAASNTSTSLPPPSSSNRLLRRLSTTLFSSVSTPVSSTLENSRPTLNSTATLSTSLHSGADTNSPAMSDISSRENLSTRGGSRTSMEVLKPKTAKSPTRIPDETPEGYVRRLVETVSKAEVTHVLAANGDAFHAQALRSYIDRFNFLDDPLDVALRKLLMDLGLPRETQQIDRVMEAFAARYEKCNPGLFANDDHPYILAFSLIMLHTDAFNKSNKNKMTKADYVKNSRLPGVPSEILECFFDNVVFAPFIFIEDPMDVNSQGHVSEIGSRLGAINGPVINGSGTTGSTILGKANKIDPYYLITQGLLGPLRADVNSHIPRSNPLLFEGTDWPWDTRRLHLLFAVAQIVNVSAEVPTVYNTSVSSVSTVSTPTRRKSIALPSLGVGNGPFIGSLPFSSDVLPSPPRMSFSRGPGPGSIRITKVGILGRKDDLLESGKRSTNRRWREWSVVLTGSQLLFFRDINFASQLLKLPDMDDASPEAGLMSPDEVISLQECVALFDTTYHKYRNTFRLLMPTGRQFLCQASDDRTLNDWISTINYACAFKTAGVSMRGLGISHKDVEMTGVAAAASHLQDLRTPSKNSAQTAVHTYGLPDTARQLEASPSRPHPLTSSGRIGSGPKLLRSFSATQSQVDLELPGTSHLEGAQQLQATFDEVKAELAANGHKQQSNSAGRVRTLSMGARRTAKTPPRPATATTSSSRSDDVHRVMSRNDIIRSCIDNWDSKISRTQHELDSELRVARNLAILTPFQRATRDRIQLAVVQLAKKVKAMRIELTKLTCYRFVLLSDLADEERHLEQAKRDALKAATQRLSTEEGLMGQHLHNETTDGPFRLTSHLRSQPSATESFYSAMDTVEGSGNLSTPLSMLSEDNVLGYPFLENIRASASRDNNNTALHSAPDLTLSDSASSPAGDGHERFYTAAETPEEIAEEWNETRAANRVSLVRIPSNVELSSVFSRQARGSNDGV